MKKILTIALLFVVALGANAQFEKGTKYVGASLTGLSASYNKVNDFNFGLQATAGYFFADNWMAKANVGYGYNYKIHSVNLGAMASYYLKSIGLFFSAGAEYSHLGGSVNDFRIPMEVGYCFYLNNHVSVEPAVYYRMSCVDFCDNSEVGLRVGFSYYF